MPTDWNVGKLTPQHQQVSFTKAGQTTKSLEQFKTDNDGSRPQTLWRLRSNNIEIKAGATTLRNRSNWNAFKAMVSNVVDKIRNADIESDLSKLSPSQASRKLRHAEFNRDKAVSNFVADVANGKFEGKPLEANKALLKVYELNNRCVLAAPETDGNGPIDLGTRIKNADADLKATFQDAMQTAMDAMPDKVDQLKLSFEAAFDSEFSHLEEARNGNSSEDPYPKTIAFNRLDRLGNEALKEAHRNTVTGTRAVEDLRLKEVGQNRQIDSNEATALARFSKSAIGGHKGGRELTAFERSALESLVDRLATKDDKSVSNLTCGGKIPEAVDLAKKMDDRSLSALMQTLRTEAHNKPSKTATPEELKLHETCVKLYDTMRAALAHDLPRLERLAVPPGGGKGYYTAWLNDAIDAACTMRKPAQNGQQAGKGDFVHTDKALEAMFDRVYANDLPRQEASHGNLTYFRNNEPTMGFLTGLTERYTDGKLKALGDRLGAEIQKTIKAPDKKQITGPMLPASGHPQIILQAVQNGLKVLNNPDIQSPKFQAFCKKLQAGFENTPQLKGHGNSFVRSTVLLRTVLPGSTKRNVSGLTTNQFRENNSANALLLSVGNGAGDNLPTKSTEIRDRYVTKAGFKIDADLAEDIKAAKSRNAPESEIQTMRDNAKRQKEEISKKMEDFPQKYLQVFHEQTKYSEDPNGNQPKSTEDMLKSLTGLDLTIPAK
ncbi:MAG: hypothetical protein AAFR47_17340, partial [Pseudomonadota bacterium]